MNYSETFCNFLIQEHYSDSTISEHTASIRRFEAWAQGSGYSSITQMTYTEILHYVQEEKKRGVKTQSINLRLNSLRLYYNHLREEGVRTDNPAKRIRIKGAVKTVTQDVLSYSELEALYYQYAHYSESKQVNNPQHGYAQKRNTAILGLLIFQGVQSGELSKLTTDHLNLKTGTLYIPSGSRSNSRELKLEPLQMVPLHTYLNETRPQLKPTDEALFTGDILQVVNYIVKELQGLNQLIKNAQQIRTSVLVYWLKKHGKRQVQYMAGHKHISSIERYEKQDMEKLTDQLGKHHPFG